MKLGRGGRASDVEDRRGAGGGGFGRMGGLPFPSSMGGRVGGVGGIAGIIIAVVVLLMNQGGGGGGGFFATGGGTTGSTGIPTDDEGEFISGVFGDVQDSWEAELPQYGQQYQRTRIVLFDGGTSTGCGQASSATGPFYCPADQLVYIDLSFWDQLTGQLGAEGGDFAEAYVVAHEVGHHVQNLLGTNAEVQRLSQQDPSQANPLSVRLELQADCYAGIWANSFTSRSGNQLDEGDIAEALDAASAVGDDRIQAKTQGRIDPESWTHGSAEQRQQWFTTGYQTGDLQACDTFAGAY